MSVVVSYLCSSFAFEAVIDTFQPHCTLSHFLSNAGVSCYLLVFPAIYWYYLLSVSFSCHLLVFPVIVGISCYCWYFLLLLVFLIVSLYFLPDVDNSCCLLVLPTVIHCMFYRMFNYPTAFDDCL